MPASSGFAPNRAHTDMLAKTNRRTCLCAPSLGAQGISGMSHPVAIYVSRVAIKELFANKRLYRYADWVWCAGQLVRITREKPMSDDEIILSELSDDELVQQMHDDLYDGLKEEIEEGTNILLGRGWTPYDVLTQALVEGMRIVGEDFRDGILFVPEVLMSANAMKSGMFILRPLLAETGAPKLGKMVIGTVKGDIHDIGKNLVGMMMEGAGFDVIDLGINNPVENYIEAIEREKPDILGMSALLTTTMPYMKVVIDTMKEKGIRDDYIVLVGGAPLNEEFGKAVGADAYCRDAAVAVETAKALIKRRHNQLAAGA
jgi:methylmalonyl-CoA mutase cobalamin-binding domain/chain